MALSEFGKLSSLKRLSVYCLYAVLVTYVAICADFYVRQEQYLMEPAADPDGMRASKLTGTATRFVLPDREHRECEVHFRRYKVQNESSKGTVFYLHGNRGDMDRCEWEFEFIVAAGYDVWTMDYRGFGQSRGHRSESTLREDAELVYNRILTEAKRPIIIWGRSFGSGVAASVAAASKSKPDTMVLETPYWSLVDTVRQRFPIVPSFLFRYELPNYQFVQSANCPIHVIFGTDDEKIPSNSSVRLAEIEGIRLELHKIECGKHNLRLPNTSREFDAIAGRILR